MPKINQEEYEVLKGLDDKGEWIARNYNGALIIYTDKPTKNPNLYWDSFGERMEDRLFQFIQWEDESPYNIAELIEEYEEHEFYNYVGWEYYKGEEKEVKKNIEWLKSAIQQNLDFYNDKDEEWQMAKVRAYAKSLDLINQLDEPEVLSSDWIDEHKESWQDLSITGYSVPEKDLQNLLVPKQIKPKELYKAITGISPFIEEVCDSSGTETFLDESVSVERIVEAVMEAVDPSEPEKPVIPQFVAEWIEFKKKSSISYENVFQAMDELVKSRTSKAHDWVLRTHENKDTFARAWLNGYTVEEEQKYVVPIGENHALCKFANDAWGIYKEDIDKLYLDDDFKFTEQEIKDYDERFWPFAVKVEELEE